MQSRVAVAQEAGDVVATLTGAFFDDPVWG